MKEFPELYRHALAAFAMTIIAFALSLISWLMILNYASACNPRGSCQSLLFGRALLVNVMITYFSSFVLQIAAYISAFGAFCAIKCTDLISCRSELKTTFESFNGRYVDDEAGAGLAVTALIVSGVLAIMYPIYFLIGGRDRIACCRYQGVQGQSVSPVGDVIMFFSRQPPPQKQTPTVDTTTTTTDTVEMSTPSSSPCLPHIAAPVEAIPAPTESLHTVAFVPQPLFQHV